MQLPRMLRLRRTFEAQRVDDVAAEVDRQLGSLNLSAQVTAGQTVALTAGSRGIANIAVLMRAAVDHFKKLGAVPFIVPAMGSHGGGTAEGQCKLLEDYGITEDNVGAEIRASMDTVVVAETPQGVPVHFDRHAYEADHVVVCGRVKPHTRFVGGIESGLHKMMLIGLGKHNGALVYHQAIEDYSFQEIIQAVSSVVLKKCKVIAGLAFVENAYDETALIEAVAPDDFLTREQELLTLARKWMPDLPFDRVDLLIVDEIGKNISGTGMDTNVIGRKYNDHEATERDDVSVKRIFIRGLTEESHGNGCGIGMAEITNQRTIDSIDLRITAVNALTAGHVSAAALPIAMPTDRDAIEAILPTIGYTQPNKARVLQIRNTLHLAELLASEVYAAEIAARDDLEVLDGPWDMTFDASGSLLPV